MNGTILPSHTNPSPCPPTRRSLNGRLFLAVGGIVLLAITLVVGADWATVAAQPLVHSRRGEAAVSSGSAPSQLARLAQATSSPTLNGTDQGRGGAQPLTVGTPTPNLGPFLSPASSTPPPTPEIPPTVVALDADFSADPCPLFEGDNEIRQYDCNQTEYTMRHKQATTRYAYADGEYTDGVIEARGYLKGGTGKYEYGIVFRATTDGTLYYVFTVTQDGKYNVALYKDQQYTDLIPYTASPIVQTDGANTFKVVMRGSEFDFFVNDQYLNRVSDSTITSGVVGLFFYNAEPNVQVGFDQLTISTFGKSTTTTTPMATSVSPTALPPFTVIPTDQPTYLAWNAKLATGSCDLFEGDNETRTYGCENGRYVMSHKQATTRYSYYNDVYGDAVIFAQGQWLSGSGSYEYGIVWRANTDGTAYYAFTVNGAGQYVVSLYKDSKYTNLIPNTSSPLVQTGATPNRFLVVARDTQFYFYLNDQYIGQVNDATIESGNVGLFLYNETPNLEVAFDALTVWTFTPPTPAPIGTAPTVTTSTPTPTVASSNLTPTPVIPQTYVSFDADLLADTCPLFEGDNETRQYQCGLAEYTMLHKQATTRYSFYDVEYDDAVVEADGYYVDGTGKYEYGLVLRANTDGSSYYVFTVTQDGKYNVALYQNQQYTDLIPYTASPIVNIDDANYFKVVMRGSQFDFWLNDQYLGHVTDSTISRGVAGLFFYNAEPNVQVGFDQLTISTFSPPTPTATPTVGAPATPTARPATTSPIRLATATPAAVPPGVFVSRIRLSPAAPKRGQPVTFFVTFLNGTGKNQGYRWLVEIWEADTNKRNAFGQADAIQQEVRVGTSELATGNSWKLSGGGPCTAFRARVVYENDQGQRVPFTRSNGSDYWLPFQVCP